MPCLFITCNQLKSDKIMKKLLFALSFLLATTVTYAVTRSIEQMKEAAKNVIGTKADMATRGGKAELSILQSGGQYTVIGYNTGGFAVIANDDRFNAVLGYSDTEFDADKMPPALKAWMKALDEAMANKLTNGDDTPTGAELRSNDYPAEVQPMVTTTWDQSAPYNSIVVDNLHGDYYTGCVATGMAQVMKYHNWPITGEEYKTYRFQPDGSSTALRLVADFENTTYQWDDMIDNYDTRLHNYTDAQAEAVATLMYHCGVAVEMNYGLDGSGAFSNMAATAYNDYFRYSAKLYLRDIYTEEDWMNMIYSELSSNRPIQYGGATNTNAGHSFVFDGYNAEGLVHVNWGWSGSGDGYYDVAILNSPTGSYSYQQDMIMVRDADDPAIPYSSQWGIYPTLAWSTSSGGILTTNGRFDLRANGTTLSFSVTNLMNCDADDFSGQLAMFAAPESGTPIQLNTVNINHASYYYVHPGSAQDYTGTVDISALADGEYRIYFASKATEETEWQTVRSNESIYNNYMLTKRGTMAVVTVGDPGWTTGISNIMTTDSYDGTVRVYTVDGVLVYSAPADGFNISDVPAKGLLIVKKGQEVTKVMK